MTAKVAGYDTIRRTVRMEEGMQAGRKEPPWPAWMDDTLTDEGAGIVKAAHDELRGSDGLDRHSRVSTEDFVTAAVVLFRALGRADLLKRIP